MWGEGKEEEWNKDQRRKRRKLRRGEVKRKVKKITKKERGRWEGNARREIIGNKG